MQYATSNSSASSSSLARQKAFNLAEAGVSTALAVLYEANDPIDPNAVGSVPPQYLEGGTYTYSASLSGLTWTITGTGSMPNPAGTGSVTRQLSTQLNISTDGTAWQYLFSDSTAGCMDISNNATISAPLYVRGDLCLRPNSHFTGSDLQVGGTLSVNNNASVGFPGSPIDAAHITQGCKKGGGPHVCTVADDVYAGTIDSSTTTITKPALDLAKWYARAAPGPVRGCTAQSGSPPAFDSDTTLNVNGPTFNLGSGPGFDCRVVQGGKTIGRLTWAPATRTLTVYGVIFFDGNIVVSGDADYQGRATVYSSGTVALNNNVDFCGVGACDATWDTATNLIVLVAGSSTAPVGFRISNNAVYQGAAYVNTDYDLSNNATNWGPVIARQLLISNNSGSTLPLAFLPPGAPGLDATIQNASGSWRG
jgi:hypothetical protein